jgi:hypothetical protein
MRSLDEIAAAATAADVRLRINQAGLARASVQSGDELFQVPLIALAMLVVGRAMRAGLATADVTTWTLSTLLRHAQVERGARDRIQWSAPLRRRCADALAFLENSKLVTVDEKGGRSMFVAADGHALIRKLSYSADESGVLIRSLERACSALRHGGLELL